MKIKSSEQEGEAMKKGRGKIGSLIAVALFAFFAFGSLAFGAKEPIKIGVVWPLTGPVSAVGSYLMDGAKIAEARINSEGGILGGPIELLIRDGANDPAQSVSAAEELVTKDKIDVFMGCWGSSPTLAVSASVTGKYGIPHVVETASSVKVTMEDGKRPNKWLFRISPTSRMEAEALEKCLVPKLGFTKVAFLAVNNDWGRGAAKEFTSVIERSGGKVVATDFINQDQTDFLTQLTKIKSSGADSIVVTSDLSQIALILKQKTDLGMKQPTLTTGGGIVPEGLIELTGKDASEGVMIVTFFAPWFPKLTKIPEEAKWFVDEYLKAGYPNKGFGECFRAYDGLKAIKAAVELAGTTDKDKVREAFQKVDTNGLSGQIKFDEFGQSKPNIVVIQVKDGKPYVPECFQ
jgi:branched-chain amino acid transport system substrate-binding protein